MKKKLPLIVYFSFLIIYLEIVYKALVLKNVFSLNTLLIILFSVPFILLFNIMSSLFNSKINNLQANIYILNFMTQYFRYIV